MTVASDPGANDRGALTGIRCYIISTEYSLQRVSANNLCNLLQHWSCRLFVSEMRPMGRWTLLTHSPTPSIQQMMRFSNRRWNCRCNGFQGKTVAAITATMILITILYFCRREHRQHTAMNYSSAIALQVQFAAYGYIRVWLFSCIIFRRQMHLHNILLNYQSI